MIRPEKSSNHSIYPRESSKSVSKKYFDELLGGG